MKRRLYAPAVLAVGLLCAQIIATAHVYLSNQALLHVTEAVMRAGYLAVPNARMTTHLDSLGTAMAGGLFFTLSIGAGLTLATLIAAWLWERVFRRHWKATAFFLLIWIAGFILVNIDGWNPAASAYLVVVPLVTGMVAVQLLPAPTPLLPTVGIFWPVSATIILALMWSLVIDRHLFTNIRDHLLLSNRVGRSISDAYYAFTLFPAEAFNSLGQKQIRTCVLDDTLDRASWNRLERTVRMHDYLPIPADVPADLTILQDTDNKQFVLKKNQKAVLSVTKRELLNNTKQVLAAYSYDQDRNRVFRTLTMGGLLLGMPLVLFIFLFNLLGALPHLFITVGVSDVISAMLCIVVGGILLVPVYRGHIAPRSLANPATALSASSEITRITALRQACQNRRDITTEAIGGGLEKSTRIAERYWLARSLAYADNPKSRAILLFLADDPVPLVACQALWAMGEGQGRAAIPEIIDRIDASAHWYIQMYGYRALRKLGWVQPRSPHLSY